MIKRLLEEPIRKALNQGKAVVILGARQVGKSTLLDTMFREREDVLWLNGDEYDVRSLFTEISSTRLKAVIGKNKIVVVDEAQKIPDIGNKLKLITDQIKDVGLVVTGSSSFELAKGVNESLTGRKREYRLYPVSFQEMVRHTDLLSERRMLKHRMVFGYYPEVVTHPGEEKAILKELADSYLYKDILFLEQVGKPDKLVRLVQALALQVGSQVSYNELGLLVGLDATTVEKYIDVLEKSFILFRLPSFSRNHRNELKSSRKVYFRDLGIRNAVIGNLAPFEARSPEEIGHLWENFLMTERMKYQEYAGSLVRSWFWRTLQQKEIDLVEEQDGRLETFEFKWHAVKPVKAPASFTNAYPDAGFRVITPDNFSEFLL